MSDDGVEHGVVYETDAIEEWMRHPSRERAILHFAYLIYTVFFVTVAAVVWIVRGKIKQHRTLEVDKAAMVLKATLELAMKHCEKDIERRHQKRMEMGTSMDFADYPGTDDDGLDTQRHLENESVYSQLLPSFSFSFIKSLLANDSDPSSKCMHSHSLIDPSFYPTYPLYRELALVLVDWVKQEKYPAVLPKFDILSSLDLSSTEEDRLQAMTASVVRWADEVFTDIAPLEAQRSLSGALIESLRPSGILTMLRMRTTKGSIPVPPPAISDLVASANAPHSESNEMTRVHVALAKHFHRASDKWWGDLKGNNSAKNAQAESKLVDVINDAGWLNCHLLPHEEPVFELRCWPAGYGARWSSDGKTFRGFLEPHMMDGHAVGWRH